MKKISLQIVQLLPFLAFLAVICLLLPAAPVQAAEFQDSTVVVLPFQVNGSDDDERMEDELTLLVGQRLAAKGLIVMPHDEMLAMIADMGLTQLDLSTARRVLQRSGADSVVYGTYTQIGQSFTIDGRLVQADISPGVTVLKASQRDKSNLLFAVEDIAGKVNSELRKHSVISRIEVRGTKALDPDVVLLRINARQGDPIDPFILDRELKRIWDMGYFSDIVLELEQAPEGMVLVFNVVEKPRISKISVEDADAIDPDDIRAAMTTQVGSVVNDKVLATDLAAINELYRKKGHYLATSTYRLEENDDHTATLIVTVNEAEQLYIQKIAINGADSFSQRTLKGELALSERWFLSFITGSGVLKEEMLERDVAALSAFYMNEGFLDVSVGVPKVDFDEDGITITYNIDEGPRYRVAGVGFSGELIDSDEALAELTQMSVLAKNKKYFDLSVMQSDVQALANYYSQYGYAFASASPQPRVQGDADNPALFIVYHMEKRQKVYVRNIILDGNTHTRDNVILREMRLVDGDAFNGQKLRRSMQRLNNLGYFELAESELVPTGNPEEVDLRVKLREKSTGAIMGGVGYSTYSKMGVTASIQENNLWGKGYNLGFKVLFSGKRNAYDISFTNPRVNDTNLSLGLDLYRWEDDFTDFNRHTWGVNPRVGYPIGEYSYVSLGYRADFYKMFDFDSGASQVLRQYEGDRVASVASFRIGRDTTDRMRPADGTVVRLITEYGGGVLGGDDSFVKLITEFQFYKTITDNTVFHFKIRNGTLFENDSHNKPPVFERFWMGGIDSVRGYRSRDIVPRDSTWGDRIGGTRMTFANVELIWHISPEVGINLVPFFDIGVNYDDDQGMDWREDNKKSAGVELRWRSPMGDLRFSWGYPFDDGWGGKKLNPRFEFSIGNFF